MIKDLIANILKLEIKDVKYNKKVKLENISEYEFLMIKIICQLQNNEEIEVYFKMIKKDKIKESIFCYWCLLYQEEINKKIDKTNQTILNKVVITEIEKERYKNSILLEIENNLADVIKYGTEVHFIEFLKYIEKNENKSSELKNWKEFLDSNCNDLLFIGVLLNESTGRMNINVL